jgi:hypothetical protein
VDLVNLAVDGDALENGVGGSHCGGGDDDCGGGGGGGEV